jgi:DNA-directed RNA polymerase subunit RPC12/RpoP
MTDLLTKCPVCRALLDEEDVFCSNCGTEAPSRDKPQAAEARTATRSFQCSGCGASMSYSAKEGGLACPFCASTELVEKKDVKTLAPRRVVPMALSHEAAVSALRAWLGRGFWRPSDLSQQAVVESMKGVYVPYWVFSGETHTYWTADTSQTPSGASGDWYPLSGEHRGKYSGILIGASGALSTAETAALCPYDLSKALPPEQVDLEQCTVEQFSLPRKYARPLARQSVEALESQACDVSYVPGNHRNLKVNVRIEGLSSEPVLLPAWIMAYRYKDEVFRFLINGQTGQATGTAPVSWLKVLAVAGGFALLALLLMLILAAMSS